MTKLLSLLMKKSDSTYQWGFTVRERLKGSDPVVIDQVTPGSLAAQYLTPGDTILKIEKVDTRVLMNSQIEALITQPGKVLDLLVLKGDAPSTSLRNSSSLESLGHNSVSGLSTGGSTASGCDQIRHKKYLWQRDSNQKKDSTKEGFTRLESGANSPLNIRPGNDEVKECPSEEKTSSMNGKNYTMFRDSSPRLWSRIEGIWSPIPFRPSTPKSDFLTRNENLDSNEERQGDITFWDYDLSESQSSYPESERFECEKSIHIGRNFDFEHNYSSRSPEYAKTPKSAKESTFESNGAFMKKPSDFLRNSYRDEKSRIRLGIMPSPTSVENVFKNTNVVSKSEYKKSTTLKQTSYSSTKGTKSFETFEHVNEIKETDKTSKTVNGGKEEVIEKIKKKKEHIIANKDDVNGQQKETKQVINDFKNTEKVMHGDSEFCNYGNEHEEVTHL